MSQQTRITARLDFSVQLPAEGEGAPATTVRGLVRGRGSALELVVDDPATWAGRLVPADTGVIAAALARREVTLVVKDADGPLVSLGRVRSSWLQRRMTGSPYVWLHRRWTGGRLLTARRRMRRQISASDRPALASLLPPSTLLPLAPTFRRPRRRPVTTTHDRPGSGEPRLVFAPGPAPFPGDRQPVFALRGAVTTLGSGEHADLRLTGLEAVHAEIRREEDDEYYLIRARGAGTARVNGAPVDVQVLRTGSRLELGEWTMSFFREEHADHGRPYGGRIGGEAGHQRPQPPRRTPGRAVPRDPGSTGGAR